MADKPLFDLSLNRQTKQIALVAAIGLAALAVYEFSSNAGTAAGTGIGAGLGEGASNAGTILAVSAGAGLLIFIFL